jgi:hypothetical protein
LDSYSRPGLEGIKSRLYEAFPYKKSQ